MIVVHIYIFRMRNRQYLNKHAIFLAESKTQLKLFYLFIVYLFTHCFIWVWIVMVYRRVQLVLDKCTRESKERKHTQCLLLSYCNSILSMQFKQTLFLYVEATGTSFFSIYFICFIWKERNKHFYFWFWIWKRKVHCTNFTLLNILYAEIL